MNEASREKIWKYHISFILTIALRVFDLSLPVVPSGCRWLNYLKEPECRSYETCSISQDNLKASDPWLLRGRIRSLGLHFTSSSHFMWYFIEIGISYISIIIYPIYLWLVSCPFKWNRVRTYQNACQDTKSFIEIDVIFENDFPGTSSNIPGDRKMEGIFWKKMKKIMIWNILVVGVASFTKDNNQSISLISPRPAALHLSKIIFHQAWPRHIFKFFLKISFFFHLYEVL